MDDNKGKTPQNRGFNQVSSSVIDSWISGGISDSFNFHSITNIYQGLAHATLTLTLPGRKDPTTLNETEQLVAKNQCLPYKGQQKLLDDFLVWSKKDNPISVRVLHGPGGRDKTRFAVQLCWKLIEESSQAVEKECWVAGFATKSNLERFLDQEKLFHCHLESPTLIRIQGSFHHYLRLSGF